MSPKTREITLNSDLESPTSPLKTIKMGVNVQKGTQAYASSIYSSSDSI
jgi:hypothetical protein